MNKMTRVSIVMFILASCLVFSIFSSVNESHADERELESYVPLNMHFTIVHLGRPPIWRTGTLSSDGKIYHVLEREFSAIREESIIEPTEEEWKAFFNVVESTNIWGLKEGSEFLPTGIQRLARVPIYWKLELEYPERILEIEGWTIAINTRVDAKGAREVFGEQTFISSNLLIANEYENIQKIFYAIEKLLGEDISGKGYFFGFDNFDFFDLVGYTLYKNWKIRNR